MFSVQDRQHMARALVLAQRPLFSPHPNPRVGCVLVKNDRVVGEGWHPRAGQAHAEVHALQQAGDQARGSTAYVTLEPCSHHGHTPPCADALIAAGVSRVVVAMEDPNPQVAGEGLRRLQAASIETAANLMKAEASQLNPGFIKRMRQGRPWLRSKLAMSLDGRTAMASGESRWITSAEARADVQKLRARSDAILTGSGTVLADDPRLSLREPELGSEVLRQPLRVVVDSRLRLGEDARLLSEPGETLIATAAVKPFQRAELLALPAADGRVDLARLMDELGRREINEVMVEAGPSLNGALLQAGLIDELVIYMAPLLMGDSARGLFHLPGLKKMAQAMRLELIDVRPVGGDWRIQARPITKR